MTPTQLGHRAAARGESVVAGPFPVGAPARRDYLQWLNAYEQVERYRAGGLDPRGHTPINPHLCIRDSRKVCNCCGSCSMECRKEGREGVLHTINGLGKKVLVKLVERLEAGPSKPDWPCRTDGTCVLAKGHAGPHEVAFGVWLTLRAETKKKPEVSTCRCGHTKYLHATGYCRSGDKGPCGCERFVPAATAKCDHTKNAKCVEPGGCALARETQRSLATPRRVHNLPTCFCGDPTPRGTHWSMKPCTSVHPVWCGDANERAPNGAFVFTDGGRDSPSFCSEYCSACSQQDADTAVTADRKRIATGLLAWFGDAPEWAEYSSDDFAQWILNGEAAPRKP